MKTEFIGLAAGFLTTIGFLPQVFRAIKTRSTGDLSIAMILIILSGVLLWFVYGLIIHDRPLYAANGLTAILVGVMLFLKVRYR
jgi:MtN3 and saliva related transmembrane protein